MSFTVNPTKYASDKSYGNACLPLSSATVKISLSDEEKFGFSTIDGGVINYNAGTKAIDNGAGIFIGDYFVGVSESYQSISNTPFVRY